MTTKKKLAEGVSKRLKYLSVEDAEFAVDSVLEHIKDNLEQGNRIELRGFGSFSIRPRKYAGVDEYYNTVYYRMSKNVLQKLNPDL